MDPTRARSPQGLRHVALHFAPSWFSVTMGTGIASVLLQRLPYNGRWLFWLSVIVLCLNMFLFVSFSLLSLYRYLTFRGLFTTMLRHPSQSLFVGTFPMGLATIINMIVYVCAPSWGDWVKYTAWGLWWFDAVVALATNLVVPFLIMHVHCHNDLTTMNATWLLPIVPTIVAAATGGIVAEVLPNEQYALWTVIISYIMWGSGFLQSMVVLAMYFHRLTMNRLPPREIIVSSFLPMGPIGQGSFALLQLGTVARKLFPQTHTIAPSSGEVIYIMSVPIVLAIWGFGLCWLTVALISIARSKFPFNNGWWAFTFPLGVYAVSTNTIAEVLPSRFFKVLGTIYSVAVILLWILVSIFTIRGVVSGQLINAPCVPIYERDVVSKESTREEEASSVA